MESTHPPTQIADSLATLSKSIYKAFAEVESRSQSEVARVAADALEARNDRDNAIKLLHESQMETQEWKQEVELLKASLRQAEATIAHQEETISLVRRESAQWKDQSRNWQEHFLRVEEERCSLVTKIEELNQRLLKQSTLNMAPLTPVSRYADHEVLKESSYDKYPLSPPEYDTPSQPAVSDHLSRPGPSRRKTPIPKSVPRSVPSTKSTKQQSHPAVADQIFHKSRKSLPQSPPPRSHRKEAPQSAPQIRVIRRVQATFHVKQEDGSDEEGVLDGSLAENDALYPEEAEPSDSGSSRAHANQRSRDSRKRRKPRPTLLSEEEEETESPPDEDAIEEEEDELMITSQDQHSQTSPSSNKRTVPQNATALVPPSKRHKANPSTRTVTRKKP